MAFFLFALFLANRPAVSQEWKQSIWIEQEFDLDRNEGTMKVRSPEYLTGARIRHAGIDTLIESWELAVSFDGLPFPDEPWMRTKREVTFHHSDTLTTVDIRLHITTKSRPYVLTATYSTTNGPILEVNTPAAVARTENTVSISWYSFPDTSLVVPLSLTVRRGVRLKEKIEAIFIEEPVPVNLEKEGTVFIRRALFRQTSVVDAGS